MWAPVLVVLEVGLCGEYRARCEREMVPAPQCIGVVQAVNPWLESDKEEAEVH